MEGSSWMLPGHGEHRMLPSWHGWVEGMSPCSLNVPRLLLARVSFLHTDTGCAGCAAGLKELSAAFEVLCCFCFPPLSKGFGGGRMGIVAGQGIQDYD